ncbi:MAG: TraU family protein [Smithellaceae bacterium]
MLDEKIYWFVAKNSPDLFDSIFFSMQKQGNRAGSLAWMPNDYPEMKVIEYLKAGAAILSTHYGSAQVLGPLIENALVPGVRIGWLHTDYFEGYFPRIFKRIDRTFLAHPQLESRWLTAGVFPELISTTGMPVNILPGEMNTSKECLTQIGFSPNIRTITIASEKEGDGDFPGIVMSITGETEEPLQIIAVCGRNEKQRRTLQKIYHKIPKLVKLEILGFISQADLVSFIHASDLFITKAGGLSPAEAFTIGNPETSTFMQAHFWYFYILGILDEELDSMCQEMTSTDLVGLSEIDPLWQDDELAVLIQPEALLYANYAAQLSCIADAISSNAGYSTSPLYWCVGSSGSLFPLTGHANNDDLLQAYELIVGRAVFRMHRQAAICDGACWYCQCMYTPIWIKHHYRDQIAWPVNAGFCHAFGTTDIAWGPGKNPPDVRRMDNLIFLLYRKRTCCMFLD